MSNSQPISDPIGIDRLQANALGLTAADHRRGMGALAPPNLYTAGNRSGVFAGGSPSSGLAQDLGASWVSGRTIRIKAGHFCVDRGSGNLYVGFVTGSVDLTLDPGDASNPRYDYIVMRVRDPGLDGASVTESAKLVVLKGTPAASPSEPSSQLTNGDMVLGCYRVPAGTSSTLSDAIVAAGDRRLFVVARGGITPRRNTDTWVGSYEGDLAWNIDLNQLEAWDGTAWRVIATFASWRTFTPTLYSAAGPVNLGSGGVATCRYLQVGKLLHLRYIFRAFRPCNLGYGTIYTLLPSGFVSAAFGESHIYSKINTIDGPFIFGGESYIAPNDTKVQPYFPYNIDKCNLLAYRVAATAGKAGEGQPYIANGYPDPDQLIIQGSIEVQ